MESTGFKHLLYQLLSRSAENLEHDCFPKQITNSSHISLLHHILRCRRWCGRHTLRIALLPSDHVVLFPRKTDGTHVLWRDGSPATQTAVCSLTIAGIAQNRRRQSEYVVEGNCGPGALHFNYKGSHSVKHPGP
ncbi:hypothetical protein M404DRAFT_619263 [Pisolithus tinctorius Marx 270]|uniref:Uncharacterized protein n=1 Tax=Pisolithus tinctorius Marx 270 TaxID=870435 RepID=A0A0C3P7K8_PISTI|nr:hypothetical protein M404DRAFT_619263 [Pisolithus tinctorius Marx 270]